MRFIFLRCENISNLVKLIVKRGVSFQKRVSEINRVKIPCQIPLSCANAGELARIATIIAGTKKPARIRVFRCS